ncbi:MAG: hypothetical protein HRT58_10710 [Crocinitomicaceae bacterium]|nr:hypothetical protein [Flavobacteriales bacterium]NQZ36125.1 hypothetical protein [Crocinitomicaceae bacterium]
MKFFSDISIWWLIPWAVICVLIAFWYYRKQKGLEEISSWMKRGLIALRSMALFVIGVLLIGLLLESIEHRSEKPVFITLIDNSTSVLNYKDSAEVKQRISNFTEKLEERYKDKFDIVQFSVGSSFSTDQPNYSDHTSNLDKGFDELFTKYYNQNIGGICFISDGNFNKGSDPRYSAEKIALTPIFTVGMGDTIRKRDQVIRNVAVNDIAFFRNKFPVEIDIQAARVGKTTSSVSIYKNGKKVASKTITYTDGNLDFMHVSLMLEATEIGFVNYVVQVESLDNESSYENNKWSFYVEVIDSRSKVLLLANSPHPDVAAVKNVIERDENVEVSSMLTSEFSGKLEDYALLILHEPGGSGSGNFLQKVKDSKIPVLYLIGTNSSATSIKQLGIGLDMPAGRRSDEVQASLKSGFQLFEVSSDLSSGLEYWPPVTVPFGKISASQGDVLLTQRIGSVVKKDPILYFTSGNRKQGAFIGEGLWKWKLMEYARTKGNKGFNELIQKSVQYLVVKKNTDALRVNLPRRFNVNDDVIINAEFYNSSLERITEPSISYVLTDEKGDKVDYTFAKGELDYRLSLGKLPVGKYDWRAKTSFNGKNYEKSGSFVVNDISLENLETSADHNLLQQIAENSNGKFYTLKNVNRMLNDIDKRTDIVTVTSDESTFKDIIDFKWLFFLLILLLGGEWFLRRRIGSY